MYIFSWLDKKQIATTKPVNDDDDKCFQALNASPASVVLNHEEVGKYSQKISQIETFRNKYDWKKYQENNSVTAFHMLYIKEKICFLLTFESTP